MKINHRKKPAKYITDGAVLQYHPIISAPESRPVTIDGEPYQLGDGSWVVKTLDEAARVVACTALSR